MKINEVESLVGITKKNIRFYEEQGLIRPGRNPENGYREYSEEDVIRLSRIKLLRQLDVPIEDIRMLEEKQISFEACMDKHCSKLSREQHSIEIAKEMCTRLGRGESSFDEVNTEKYFEEIKVLEEEGVRFVDIEKTDVRKKRNGAWISAMVMIVLMAALIIAVISSLREDPTPAGVMPVILITVVILAAVICGVIIALRQRLKEIDKGEEDEARKY